MTTEPLASKQDMATVGKMSRPSVVILTLILVLILATAIRWPMLSRAERHLDSDLAVDGLTLREFLNEGQWRWHYPGTPHIGTLPVLLSLPAVTMLGDGSASLVFAGLVANLLLISAIFLLVNRQNGLTPAVLTGLILAAGGLGQVWLSARVTGGHLLASAWLAWAWVAWLRIVKSRKVWPWLLLSLYCSAGLWVDSLFAMCLPGLGLASLIMAWISRREIALNRRFLQATVFLIALPFGPLLNHMLGDAYNAYGSQFEITTDPSALRQHTQLLVLECLPRLILGRTFKAGSTGIQMTHLKPIDWATVNFAQAAVLAGVAILVCLLILRTLTTDQKNKVEQNDDCSEIQLLWLGNILTAVITVAAFRFNKNIYNADNYRYLVLLIPLAGMTYGQMAGRGRFHVLRQTLLFIFACILATDVVLWQHANGFRGRSPQQLQPSLSELLQKHDLINYTFEADYWEVYRGLYLVNKPLTQARPFGFFPNRFPEKAPTSPQLLVISRSPTSIQMLQQAKAEGARLKFTDLGFEVYERKAD